MTVRSTAAYLAAARFLLGHGPASAAAPKHVILIMMENHGTDTSSATRRTRRSSTS